MGSSSGEFDDAGLPRTEAMLLDVLRSRPNIVWSRRGLLEAMHGKSRGNVQEHAVDAMVARLRRHLGPVGACIETVRREGFLWNANCVSIDPKTGETRIGGRQIALTEGEAMLMSKLAARPGRLFSRGQLSSGIRCRDAKVSRVADAMVAAIRRKLGDAAECVETVHGRGYRFRPDLSARKDGEPGRAHMVRRSASALGLLLVAAGTGAALLLRPWQTAAPPPEAPPKGEAESLLAANGAGSGLPTFERTDEAPPPETEWNLRDHLAEANPGEGRPNRRHLLYIAD